ncbi:putative F-box/LRR-repeat protein At3g59170 [Trifolium pratense]|uniref:putative F-box/LRR-repeat protein At3g59170 n=1 Tax=Trifolium pratense TaxID=57577 RepID=UPI001E692C3A|nr:putative F-box/LRR-repeat protein At3g59170 [Trifolium pratense]
MDDRISELSDCILSHIMTMLSIKDLLKTSMLSRRWYKLWSLRRDLNFDIFNVFGNSEEELLQTRHLIDVHRNYAIEPEFIFIGVPSVERSVNLDISRDEFVKRVDQFVKNFQGKKIDYFRVNFFLNHSQSNTIDQWISFAISRGVGKIDLLFLGRPYVPFNLTSQSNRYKFDFALFSETNTSTLNHMRLENCLVCHPINYDFIPLKNLRYLSFEEVKLNETFIESLLSNCPQLEELCLLICEFESSMPKIVSSSLCHLKVRGCYVASNHNQWELNLILLDCLKLTSLELDCLELTSLDILNFNTPMLKSIKFFISLQQELDAFATFFPQLENMHVTTFSMITIFRQTTQPFKHLKQLNLIVYTDSYILDDVEYDSLWILNILQASPLLQKLSVMFADSIFSKNQKDFKDVQIFSHDELKVIELGGCVGNWHEIEFVMNVLKYARSLNQIVVSPYWREGDSLNWKCNPMWFESGRERMREKLKGNEVVGREKLMLI